MSLQPLPALAAVCEKVFCGSIRGIAEVVVAAMQEALLLERRKLEEAIANEMKGKATIDAAGAAPASEGPGAASSSAAASSSSAAASGAEAGEVDDMSGGVDALDAFMSNVESQIEQDKVRALSLHISIAFRL